ncbi:MAG: membrane protein insertase YidC [Bacteroidales bacterium]|nr:membrane protein insertase YidC [Bacteroidales bacterium]
MDRNSVIGLILIAAILIVFSIWNTPNQKALEEARRKADSIALAQQNQAKKQVADTQSFKNSTDQVKAKDSIQSFDQYAEFAKAAKDTSRIISIENDVLKLEISTKGGGPYSVELKKYKTFDKKPLILFYGDSTVFGFNFYTRSNRVINTAELFFKPLENSNKILLSEADTAKSLHLRLHADANRYIEYIYTLRPGSYKVDFKVRLVGIDSLLAPSTTQLDLVWATCLRAQEKEVVNENTYTDITYKFNQEDVEKLEINGKTDEKTENLRNRVKWIAYKQQFFSSVLVGEQPFENATLHIRSVKDTSLRLLKYMKTEAGVAYSPVQKTEQLGFWFYFGPNHYQTLRKFNLDLEELVRLGGSIVKFINRFLIIPVFNFLSKFISNYGIIILLLTIFIKLLIFPLTYKSYLSMAKMRVLKPQIDQINERIPAEKAMERQQAIMALYKRAGVNPLGGCLPMLLQFPVLIAMFYFFPTSIELRQQSFLWAKDLSSYDAIISWNAHIPLITEYFGNHISLFNLLMTITTIITMRMNNQSNASQQTLPGMQTMMYMMPIIFMFVLNKYSSGLTYYYFLANVITIIQNEIFKRSIDENKLLQQLNENKKKPVKKSSFQARLEEAARKRGYKR